VTLADFALPALFVAVAVIVWTIPAVSPRAAS
jgi:hypothetical protein